MPQKVMAGIESVIQSLLDQAVLDETTNPCDNPILPIPKPGDQDGSWLVQDLQKSYNISVPIAQVVPDTNSILAALSSNSI